MQTYFKINKKSVALVLLIILLLCMYAMYTIGIPLKTTISKNGIVSFELAKSIEVSKNILNHWDKNAKINAGLNLGLDFLFIFIYSFFIALLIHLLNNKLWKGKAFYKVGKFLIILIFIAGFFDIIENFALIKLLQGDLQQIWSSVAFYFASIKFIFVIICILYIISNGIISIFKK